MYMLMVKVNPLLFYSRGTVIKETKEKEKTSLHRHAAAAAAVDLV